MGHISPLLGIILELNDEYNFIYFGLKGSMEEEICKKNNIKFHAMNLKPFYRKNIFKNVLTFYHILKEKKNIKIKYKDYNLKMIISSGGFVSIPLVLSFKNTKKILLESNTTLGLANRFLIRFVNYLCIQFDTIENKKKVVLGNPIKIYTQSFDHQYFYLNEPLILFVGGSNGAKDIIDCALKFNKKYPLIKMFVITGERYFSIEGFNQNVKVFKRIDNLNSIFHKFKVVVSRAGAATITELMLEEVVFVLFPSKNVSGNHQVLNAKYLVENNCCEMINDISNKSLELIYELLFNLNKRTQLKINQNNIIIRDSIKRIKDLINKENNCDFTLKKR